jgi:hypothetical protein
MTLNYVNNKLYTKVPLSNVIEPKHGSVVYCNYYWVVTPDECIIRFSESAWQGNSKEEVSKILQEKIYKDCRIEFFPILYLPPDPPERH